MRVAPILKHVVSWIVIVPGLLLGVLGVRTLEVADVFGSNSPLEWSRILGCSVAAFLIPLASVIAIGNRRRASLLTLIAAPTMGVCAVLWQERLERPYEDVSFLQAVVIFTLVSLFFLAPGLFWYFTSRAKWPPLMPSRSMRGFRIQARALVCSLLFGASVLTGLILTFLLPHQWVYIPDRGRCRDTYSTVSAPRFPDSVIFTARVALVGSRMLYDPEHSDWCFARVERRYVGLPWWAPGLVVLRGYYFKKGEKGEYFVDGRRSQGLLTHFLPVFQPYFCCHMQPFDRAVADLRVLDDGASKPGVRVIGRVYWDSYANSAPARGVQVLITGPDGTISTTTDQQGIYDRAGLPAGHYSVRLEDEGLRNHFYPGAEGDARSGEAWGGILIAQSARTVPEPK